MIALLSAASLSLLGGSTAAAVQHHHPKKPTEKVAIAAGVETIQVSDFFPTAPGTTWSFDVLADGKQSVFNQQAIKPVAIGKYKTSPIQDMTGAVQYYFLKDNSVYLMGSDPKSPLKFPRPILVGGSSPQSWNWEGQDGPMLIHMDAKATLSGNTNVLGSDVPSLHLEITAEPGTATKTFAVRQTAIYAKGIGLVQMDQEITSGSHKSKLSLKLKSFHLGSG